MNVLIETENLGVRFWLERQEAKLVRDVIFHPFRPRFSGREFWAISGISFRLEKGRILGVIGRNGAGKTTLLMALAGIYAPDQGRIRINGRVSSLLEVGAGFRRELTGRENVFLYGAVMGMNRKRIQNCFDEIVNFSELEGFIDTPLRTYSAGMRMRLGFATAMSLEPDILLIDEALAIGDSAFQRQAMDRIEVFCRNGGTLVYVSHDMNRIGDICHDCLLLEKGKMVKFGEPLDVIATYWERIWGTHGRKPVSGEGPKGSVALKKARRWGSGNVIISRFVVSNHLGNPTGMIEQGYPLSIQIHFQGETDPGDLLFQVSFFQQEKTIAVLKSHPEEYPKGLACNGGVVHLRIETESLPLGTFQLDAEIRNEAFTEMYDHLDKFVSIEIVKPIRPRDPKEWLSLSSQWTFSPRKKNETTSD